LALQLYFIENLSLKVWLLSVLPYMLKNREGTGNKPGRCYVVDGSALSLLAAKVSAWAAGISVERFEFRLMDIRDEEGLLLSYRIPHEDFFRLREYIAEEPAFIDLIESGRLTDRMPIFLLKNILNGAETQPGTLWRTLLLIRICDWKTKFEQNGTSRVVIFLGRRLWSTSISRYASEFGISVIPVQPVRPLQTELRRRLPRPAINLLRFIRYRIIRRATALLNPRCAVEPSESQLGERPSDNVMSETSGPSGSNKRPLVAVDIYGQFNLNKPELQSDLFFWHGSALPGDDLLLTFSLPRYPLDEAAYAALKRRGMEAVALNPGATTVGNVPVFPRPHISLSGPEGRTLATGAVREEGESLVRQLRDYHSIRAYWSNLFESFNVKVYTTWYKHDGNHCVIADALQALGGITAIYQRSYQPHPFPQGTISADLAFVYSQTAAEVERLGNSNIRYQITTGYLNDLRFPMLREKSNVVSDTLRGMGATYILAFFDENSAEDERWNTGHDLVRDNYTFLLEKVLSNPWLGLVIKPKLPGSLRHRLGPVADLLKRATATGRCHIFDGGVLHSSHAPAEAALAADLVIHGHLCAATAGLEAALAGKPTLLFDGEGAYASPLRRLGCGNVVFNDWEELWEALLEHLASPEGMPGFGDWSPMLEELDPFQDGRAAERMGEYIRWLIEGYQNGLDRDTVMANAAERYCSQWGADKITEVNFLSQSNGHSEENTLLTGSTHPRFQMDTLRQAD